MRESNHLPWMGRTMVTAIMVLVGLGVFAGQARAQALDLTDIPGWWDSLNCKYMIGSVIASDVDTTATFTAGTDGDTVGEVRWCKKWAGLAAADRTLLTNAANHATNGITRKTSAEIISVRGWWGALSSVAQDTAVGMLRDGGATTGVPETDDELAAAIAYGLLTVAETTRVNSAFEALKMGAMATEEEEEEEEAPALPLVGVGILGLLLAGRGAWLRRRNA